VTKRDNSIDRRDFIKLTASGIALSGLAAPLASQPALADNRFSLHAGKQTANLTGDGVTQTNCWLYNGMCPGPMLRARQGDLLKLTVTNNLDVPTTVHWHGIRNVNEMDGVADLTQAPIAPGDSFAYDVPLTESGTYWYHAHNMGWEQVARGLYGPLIVDGDDDPVVDHDFTLMIDDWRLDQDGQIDDASFQSLHDWSHGGRLGNWLTVNGASDPRFSVTPGARIRLRLINAANARIFKINISGADATVIAEDGAVCQPEIMNIISLAPAQRVDVILDIDSQNIVLQDVSTGTPYPAGQLIADMASGKAVGTHAPLRLASPAPLPNLDQIRTIPVHMQGGAMGNLSSAILDGESLPLRSLAREHKKLWAFNGIVGTYSEILAEIPLGPLVALDIFNDTAWPHAMHLHGHHFWVLLDNPTDNAPSGKRDTWLMPAGSRAKLVFVADNPGLWLFHCHMLEHAASGMGMVLAVG